MATIEQLIGALKQADAAGNTEDAQRIADIIKRQRGAAPEPAPKEQAGFFSSLLKGATELGEAPAAARFAAAKTPEEQAKARAELTKPPEEATTSFSDVISGKGKFTDWVKQVAGSSAGALAAPAAAAGATLLTPAAPLAPIVGGATLVGQYLTGALGRQAQEQQRAIQEGRTPEETSVAKAGLAAAGETALDVFGFKFFKPVFKTFPVVGGLFGEGGEQLTKKTVNQLTDAFEKGKINYKGGVAYGVGKGVAFEIPQEIAQTALERWQAGLSLTDEEARHEYVEAGAGALLLGGTLGGASGGIKTATDKAVAERVLANKAEREQRRLAEQEAEAAGEQAVTPPEAALADQAVQPSVSAPTTETVERETVPADTEGVTWDNLKPGQSVTLYRGEGKEQTQDGEWWTTDKAQAEKFGEVTEVTLPAEVIAANAARGHGGAQEFVFPTKGKRPSDLAKPQTQAEQPQVREKIETPTTPDEYLSEIARLEREQPRNAGHASNIKKKIEKYRTAYEQLTNRDADDALIDQAAAKGAADATQLGTATETVAGGPATGVAPTVQGQQAPAGGVSGVTGPGVGGPSEVTAKPTARKSAVSAPLTPEEAADLVDQEADAAEAAAKPRAPVVEKEKGEERGASARQTVADIAESVRTIRDQQRGVQPITKAKFNDNLDYLVDVAEDPNSTDSERGTAQSALKQLALPEAEVNAARERVQNLKQRQSELIGDAAEVEKLQKRIDTLNLYLQRARAEYNDAKSLDEDTTTLEDEVSSIEADLAGAQKQLKENIKRVKSEKAKAMRSPTRREGPTLGVAKVQEIVNRVKSFWKGAPDTRVVASIEDLPSNLRSFLETAEATDVPGIFDPRSKRVYLIADNIATEEAAVYTLVHEAVGHYGLREVLGDKYDATMNNAYLNPAIKAAADALMKADPSLSKQEAVEEVIAEKAVDEYATSPAIRNIVDRIANAIRAFIRKISGGKAYPDLSDAEIRSIVGAAQNFVTTGKGASASGVETTSTPAMRSPIRPPKAAPTTTQAPALRSVTPEAAMAEFEADMDRISSKSRGVAAAAKFMRTNEGYEWLVKKFQNDRVAVKNLQDGLRRAGKLLIGEKNFNNLYDILTLSQGNAYHAMNQYAFQDMKALEDGIQAYMKKSGLEYQKALARLHLYMIALHEPERRMVKYLRTVPLKPAAADRRAAIYKELAQNKDLVTNGEAAKLRKELEALVAANKDPEGISPEGYNYRTTDINAPEYNVIGGYDATSIKAFKDTYDADPNKKELSAILKALQAVQKDTIELNEQANYWTKPVNNLTTFYGYENYVPFKGKPGSKEEKAYDKDYFDDPSNPRLSGDLNRGEAAMEGRLSNSDNPLLQTLADAASASMRVGRKDIVPAIRNLIEQKYIRGKVGEKIPFEERMKIRDFSPFQGEGKYLLYNADGSMQLIEVQDRRLNEGIKRGFRAAQPFVQMVNSITSGVGQLHTRYNPAFGPMNFVRDILTNAFTLGAELGPREAARFLGAVTSRVVMDRGLPKALKVAKLYQEGKVDEINKLAASDKMVSDIIDYLKYGGRVSYIKGLAVQGQMDELTRSLDKGKIAQTKESVDKWVDIWTDMFELTSRAAAFGIARDNALAKSVASFKKENGREPDTKELATLTDKANIEGTSYAKNLANFEQVGEWGRAMGAAFMFFRPAATGAARALDALFPGLPGPLAKFIGQDVDSLIARLPESVRNDPEAVKEFKKSFEQEQKYARQMVYGLLGAGATAYLMAWMMADDDEQGRNRVAIDDMSRWTRYARLPIGDSFMQIPWGFGFGSFAAAGAQVMAAVVGKSNLADMGGNLVTIGLDSFVPIPFSRMNPLDNFAAWAIDSTAPSLARPFIEYVMNVDSLGREIYNNRQSRVGDAYTGGDNIPELYKSTTKWLANLTNGGIDWSPNTLYFFANNYLDGVTRIAQNGTNIGMTLTGQKDFDPKTDLIFLDSFIGKKSNFDAREFVRVENEIKEKSRRLKMFENNPEQLARYITANPMDMTLVDLYNEDINGLIKDLRTQANDIRQMQFLTPKEKKAVLDGLILSQNFVKRGLIDTYKFYGVEP
jgi:hypothetical protein